MKGCLVSVGALLLLSLVVCFVAVVLSPELLPEPISTHLVDHRKPAQERLRIAKEALAREEASSSPNKEVIANWKREIEACNRILGR